MSTYRILSLDGGGIRGYLTALLLERLETESPGFLAQFDLIAGTSTGSIIALALAAGRSIGEVRALYACYGRHIFHDSLFDNVKDLGSAIGARYGRKNLQKMLEEQFGETKLRDLKRRVLIASFDLDHPEAKPHLLRMWKAKFFHNFEEGSDGAERVVDVILRSSAAPFYFPVYQGYVDGFVVANNPAMCALAQALSTTDHKLEDLVLFSVGTGLNPRYIATEDADWGWMQWMMQVHPVSRRCYALPLIYMMWEGSVELVNFQCRQLLNGRFFRLDPELPRLVDIDDVAAMPLMKEVARKISLQELDAWVKAFSHPPAIAP
jgi:patatin-like phospholipase/acyl hydrolase